MAKLMWIAGILLLAAGVALGVMFFVSNASVAAWLSFETVVTMLVGGILALGLGSTVSGLDRLAEMPAVARSREVAPVATAPAPVTTIPEFGRRQAEAPAPAPVSDAPAAAAIAASAGAMTELSEPTRETLQALEQARQKIEQAFDTKPAAAQPAAVQSAPVEPAAPEAVEVEEEPAAEEPAEETVAEDEPAADDEAVLAEGELYVVEEKIIRMRPARVLSDGTVEAETEEGWMRFENLEHLDEYLDAMPSGQA